MTDELTAEARKLFEALPAEGKVGGKKIRERINMRSHDFRLAKQELKEAGLVTLGRGRGGSVGRVEGAELPPEPEKETPAERMAHAREVKVEKSRAEQERDAIRERVVEIGWRDFPDADEIKPGRYENSYYVEVWKNGHAGIKYIDPEDLL